MSATATALPAPLREHRPPFERLVRVELRKTADTRAGFWLLLALALMVLGTAVIYLLAAKPEDLSFEDLFRVVQFPINVLLPVLGILLVTSEWSQRTALATFTLVPDRRRVVAAKAGAVVALTLAAMLVSFVVAAVANAIGGHPWNLGADTVGELFLFQLAALLGGFAFGLALQSSAPAIVLYYIAPTLVSIVVEIVHSIQDAARWVDLGQTTTPIADGTASGQEWAQFGTSAALWILVPLVIGLWRLSRSEMK
jgi:ABC-type transport system involved in multi-copper enzyme maturation permease subunit